MYEITQNSKKIWTYSSSRSSKVIDLCVNGKPICHFLLVINCNFVTLLPFLRYSDLKTENCWFYPPLPSLMHPSGGTPWDINVFYRPLKSTFTGPQFCLWHYRSIFIRLAIVASQNRKIRRNSDKIWISPAAVQGHPRSSILESLYVTSYESLIVTLANLQPFSRYSGLKIENCWFYQPLPCLRPRSGGTP